MNVLGIEAGSERQWPSWETRHWHAARSLGAFRECSLRIPISIWTELDPIRTPRSRLLLPSALTEAVPSRSGHLVIVRAAWVRVLPRDRRSLPDSGSAVQIPPGTALEDRSGLRASVVAKSRGASPEFVSAPWNGASALRSARENPSPGCRAASSAPFHGRQHPISDSPLPWKDSTIPGQRSADSASAVA